MNASQQLRATTPRRSAATMTPLPSPTHEPRIGQDVPVRVDRRTGAELLRKYFFPVSRRTLEAWPLPWRRVNGRALCETADLFALARAKLDEAARTMGGRAPAGGPDHKA